MAERFKAPVLKTGVGASSPWVRIPPHPPNLIDAARRRWTGQTPARTRSRHCCVLVAWQGKSQRASCSLSRFPAASSTVRHPIITCQWLVILPARIRPIRLAANIRQPRRSTASRSRPAARPVSSPTVPGWRYRKQGRAVDANRSGARVAGRPVGRYAGAPRDAPSRRR